ncbi:FAD-dependent monooxygenase [Pandoraea pulmonicola]|uniref:2,4-dichlorophenol 6-monooxygenase n=1 Tax=Pandoraea pulmonicola TaxID=93221 RepID=A0AAJ4ZG55_PANPU|nr:FAD-dependent monooxygenase [Pandoraea pulmonicola]AJC22888.1 hypothetical protein RO07_24930 [Pandoraea pulmonicola]SUA92789.1 2,4-dichlorophenol 6-monooxygenase [Pandoraea pulmonicola]
MKDIETSVLIVGAGPVGLALANELAYRGIAFILVEKSDGSVLFPAGEGIFSRTMEHLRRWGLADRARVNEGFPDDYPLNVGFATSLSGKLLAAFEAPSNRAMPARSPHSPEGNIICPKQIFDPLLRRGAEERGADLRYDTELLDFRESGETVVATVRNDATGSTYEIHATYLAACDGGRSHVRKRLNIPFIGEFATGHNFAVFFRAPELLNEIESRFGKRFVQLHTVNTPNRPYFTSVNGRDQWRMSMYVPQDTSPDPAAALSRAIGIPLQTEIIRAQPWAGHRVVASKYRVGRTFLLGDAVQLRWPKGGFGANTGIGDAVDLGWKLAATIQGWGGSALLDSYEVERRPIAVRNVNEGANNRTFDALIEQDPMLDDDSAQGQARRTRVENQIHALRLREFQTQGIQLGYRYRQSPICLSDDTLEPPDDHMSYQPSTWPGSRAPHAWLDDRRSTLDLFGRGFVLVRFDNAPGPTSLTAAARSLGMPFEEAQIHSSVLRNLYERDYVLVRPDGHVAWRADALPEDALSILNHVRGGSPRAA